MRTPWQGPAAVVLVLIHASAAQAQFVTGRITSASGGEPVPHAFVRVLDEHGQLQGAVLSDSVGRYSLRLATAGRYTLHVERIGYETASSAELRIGVDSYTHDFVLQERPLALERIQVESGPRGCGRQSDGETVYHLWSEIQKALRLTNYTYSVMGYTITQYVRDVDLHSRVLHEEYTTRRGRAAFPFNSAPPAELIERGFFRPDGAGLLLGVDTQLLLSDEFVNHYCFHLERAPERDLIGLGFQPLRNRGVADVRGVLWVDERTAELRQLTYTYLNLPEQIAAHIARAEVHFRKLATDLWVVDRWWIRAPRVSELERQTPRGTLVTYELQGHREHGGFVTDVHEPGSTQLLIPGSSISGRIVEDTESVPRGRTRVYLSGTAHSGAVDEEGRFRIYGLRPSEYSVTADDSVLEDLRVAFRFDTVQVGLGRRVVHDITWPSQVDVLSELCPGTDGSLTERGLLYGDVMDSETLRPVSGADVHVYWRGADVAGNVAMGSRTATSGADGRYYVCWIPVAVDLTVTVEADRMMTRHVELRLMSPVQRWDPSMTP